MGNMNEMLTGQLPYRSRVVTLVVERGENGGARLVLEGSYMAATGFVPGDRVDAIVQPELISILHRE